ncbi:MAG: phenylalanine--tRNA ligase beta subunit-related protein [Bacteroidales bacterium]|jgi:DNA/RNA-binding domain of Phe-tRNA-synthetase-like protein
MLSISPDAKELFPDLKIGLLLISNIKNAYLNNKMAIAKDSLIEDLKQRYGSLSRKDLIKTEVLKGYYSYYKSFTKTYHVLLQLESVIYKEKGIPFVSPIVQSMFMAELKNHFLTSVHDYSKIVEPLYLDRTLGSELFTLFNGEQKTLKKDDLYIRDTKDIISNVLNGMDERTKVTVDTHTAMYNVYVPFSIDDQKILSHLDDMANYLKLNDESIIIEERSIYQ